MYHRHEDCNGDGRTFNSAVYDLQASGYPTFWRSFKCVTVSTAAGETQQDLPDAMNSTTDMASQNSAATPSTDVQAGAEARDSILNSPAPVSDNLARAEPAKGEGDDNGSTSDKWNCPAGVAGVPYNHCVSNAGMKAVPSARMKLAFGGVTIAILLWLL